MKTIIRCTEKQKKEKRNKKSRIANPIVNVHNLNEDDIIEHVCHHTKYLDVGPSAYHAEFEGRLYTAADTRDLVVEICRDLGIKVTP